MRKEIKIGLIMIIALGVLIWGLNYLKGRNFFSKTVNYVVIYDDVSGLLESNGVYIKGYKVGNVHSISFSDSTLTQLRVILAIDRNVHIPVGTKARIYNLDLIGNKAVELIFSNNKTYYNENDTIIGEVEITIAKQLEPYKVQAYNLLNSLDSLTHAIYRIFDRPTVERIKLTIKNLQITTEAIANSMENTHQTIKNIEYVSLNLKENTTKLNTIMHNLQLFSRSLNQLQINETIGRLDSVLIQTQTLLTSIEKGNGTISKLIYSDSLYRNLQQSIIHLDSLLQDIKDQPNRYLYFSVFGKNKNK